MPILMSKMALPLVPPIYDVTNVLVNSDRKWFAEGNQFLFPDKKSYKETKFTFSLKNMFNEIHDDYIGVPENMNGFSMGGKASDTALFALSPPMVKAFVETTTLTVNMYKMVGRLVLMVKKINVAKHRYDGNSLRRFNKRGMRSVRGYVSSIKYRKMILASIINAHQFDNNMSDFMKKYGYAFFNIHGGTGSMADVRAAPFDPSKWSRIDKTLTKLPIDPKLVRLATRMSQIGILIVGLPDMEDNKKKVEGNRLIIQLPPGEQVKLLEGP